MITANDLRIGNWVLYFDVNVKIDSIRKDTHYYLGGIGYNGCTYYNAIEAYKPIPITPEILEKAGFKIVESYDEEILENDYQLESYSETLGESCIYISFGKERYKEGVYVYSGMGDPESYGYGMKHIKYVHQLQNLYYCLVGEELKIEL